MPTPKPVQGGPLCQVCGTPPPLPWPPPALEPEFGFTGVCGTPPRFLAALPPPPPRSKAPARSPSRAASWHRPHPAPMSCRLPPAVRAPAGGEKDREERDSKSRNQPKPAALGEKGLFRGTRLRSPSQRASLGANILVSPRKTVSVIQTKSSLPDANTSSVAAMQCSIAHTPYHQHRHGP